jgi:hypothetical protein
MRLYLRLLLTLPFVLLSFFYCKNEFADNSCRGLIELLLQWTLFPITFFLSAVAIFLKRKVHKFKPEPYSLTVTVTPLICFWILSAFSDSLKGAIWIKAEDKKTFHRSPFYDLTLRKNGRFTLLQGSADFGCYFSGDYQIHDDTLIFDNKVITETDTRMTARYLMHQDKLLSIPEILNDSSVHVDFDIIKK